MHALSMEVFNTTSQQRCCRLREAPYRRAPEGLQASAVMDSVSSVSVAATAPVSTSTIWRPPPPAQALRTWLGYLPLFGEVHLASIAR